VEGTRDRGRKVFKTYRNKEDADCNATGSDSQGVREPLQYVPPRSDGVD
jgi:hypothetical protein